MKVGDVVRGKWGILHREKGIILSMEERPSGYYVEVQWLRNKQKVFYHSSRLEVVSESR